MATSKPMSKETQRNWLVDAAVFLGGILAAITGVYFLFLPVGGYQGGRNPMYGVVVLFERHTWDDLHTWGGIVMIAALALHFTLHWSWIANMAKRMWKKMLGQGPRMNRHGYFNVAIDLTVAISFLLAAVSAFYFLFVPGGRSAADPMILFPRNTWDLIHTWSGVVVIAAAVVHFAIHWRWVVKVTKNVFRSTWAGLPRTNHEPAVQPVQTIEPRA